MAAFSCYIPSWDSLAIEMKKKKVVKPNLPLRVFQAEKFPSEKMQVPTGSFT